MSDVRSFEGAPDGVESEGAWRDPDGNDYLAGLVVGRSARGEVWPRVVEWLEERSEA